MAELDFSERYLVGPSRCGRISRVKQTEYSATHVMRKLPAVITEHAVVVQQRRCHPNPPLTEAQIRSLLHAVDNIRDDALIRLGLSTEVRVSEAVTVSARAKSTTNEAS